jgi:hypothetical protein
MKKCFSLKNSWSNNKNSDNISLVLSKISIVDRNTAIKNMKAISHNPFDNPSTNMDLFFTKIESLDQVDNM